MKSTIFQLLASTVAVLGHKDLHQRDTRQFFGYTDLECAGDTIITGPVTTGECVPAPNPMTSAQIFGPNFWEAQVQFFSDSNCQNEITDVTEVGDNEASLCFDMGTRANSAKYISSL